MPRFDMKRAWDELARKDAPFAIALEEGRHDVVFRASGQRDAAILLAELDALLPGRDRVLEIGCGIGRLLEPLAEHFRQLHGVDVSGEMVRQGRRRLTHLPQVQFIEVDGSGMLPFAEASFDFCFSYITFHHIPYKEVVRRYIAETQRVLVPGGIFRFQLFGRPEGLWQDLRERFTRKSTWRGCKFTLAEVRRITQEGDFETLETLYREPDLVRPQRFYEKSAPHIIWVTARKPARTSAAG